MKPKLDRLPRDLEPWQVALYFAVVVAFGIVVGFVLAAAFSR